MIDIIQIEYLGEYKLKLWFSNESFGVLDFRDMVLKEATLTKPLRDKEYFKSCFIDFGALCWKNGLELSAESLYLKAKNASTLQNTQSVA